MATLLREIAFLKDSLFYTVLYSTVRYTLRLNIPPLSPRTPYQYPTPSYLLYIYVCMFICIYICLGGIYVHWNDPRQPPYTTPVEQQPYTVYTIHCTPYTPYTIYTIYTIHHIPHTIHHMPHTPYTPYTKIFWYERGLHSLSKC